MDSKQKSQLLEIIRSRVLVDDPDFKRFKNSASDQVSQGLVDYLFAVPGDLRMPDQVFDRLRWGGRFIFISPDAEEVRLTARPYKARPEFAVETEPACIDDGRRFFRKEFHYFIARKVHLVHAGEFSHRFTYQVELVSNPEKPGEYLVQKQIPSIEQMEKRLNLRHPELDMDDIHARAASFTRKIFPLFLSREVGMLKVLNKYLPESYRDLVPQVVDSEKNEKGQIARFTMSWLRNGRSGSPLPHLEYAAQMADLLRILHDTVKIIHLDLRPDNMVITDRGVGFIDFGSSVRIGEDLTRSKILMKMFEQVMVSSGIQKMLGQMCDSGIVTSRLIRNGYRKVDKSVDLFFMVLQMNKPLSNPDFHGLIEFDPDSIITRNLAGLTKRVLKPKNPDKPEYVSAEQVYQSIQTIARNFSKKDTSLAEAG